MIKKPPPRQLSLLGLPSRSNRRLGVATIKDRSIIESPPQSPRSHRAATRASSSSVSKVHTGSSFSSERLNHSNERQTSRLQEGDILRDSFLLSQWRSPPVQLNFDEGCVEQTAHLSAIQSVAQGVLGQDLIPSSVSKQNLMLPASKEGAWRAVAGLKIAHRGADDFVHWISESGAIALAEALDTRPHSRSFWLNTSAGARLAETTRASNGLSMLSEITGGDHFGASSLQSKHARMRDSTHQHQSKHESESKTWFERAHKEEETSGEGAASILTASDSMKSNMKTADKARGAVRSLKPASLSESEILPLAVAAVPGPRPLPSQSLRRGHQSLRVRGLKLRGDRDTLSGAHWGLVYHVRLRLGEQRARSNDREVTVTQSSDPTRTRKPARDAVNRVSAGTLSHGTVTCTWDSEEFLFDVNPPEELGLQVEALAFPVAPGSQTGSGSGTRSEALEATVYRVREAVTTEVARGMIEVPRIDWRAGAVGVSHEGWMQMTRRGEGDGRTRKPDSEAGEGKGMEGEGQLDLYVSVSVELDEVSKRWTWEGGRAGEGGNEGRAGERRIMMGKARKETEEARRGQEEEEGREEERKAWRMKTAAKMEDAARRRKEEGKKVEERMEEKARLKQLDMRHQEGMRELESLRVRICKYGATGMFTGSQYASKTLERYTDMDHKTEIWGCCKQLGKEDSAEENLE